MVDLVVVKENTDLVPEVLPTGTWIGVNGVFAGINIYCRSVFLALYNLLYCKCCTAVLREKRIVKRQKKPDLSHFFLSNDKIWNYYVLDNFWKKSKHHKVEKMFLLAINHIINKDPSVFELSGQKNNNPQCFKMYWSFKKCVQCWTC